MIRHVVAALVAMGLAACATPKMLLDTGGSRADGVVELGYQYGQFEVPQVDYAQGQELATRRCRGWGYDGAEKFGGEMQNCVSFDGYGGCAVARLTVRYQCLKDEDR